MSIKYYQNLMNDYINKYLLNIKNEKLREIIRYSLDGGKRLRSIIVLDISKTLGNDYLYEMALSVELLHNASLILDDLPCMDNDKLRREKDCLHIKYGEFQAKLIANYLFFESYRLITSYNNNILSCLFKEICVQNKLACYGQYFDLFNQTMLNEKINIDKINLKTSPFFIIAFLGGYLLSTNNSKNINLVKKIGVVFSNFFQMYDDFDDYEKDKEKENNINQVVLLGKERTYKLFIENKDKFLDYLNILNLKSDLMIEIVEYLVSKVNINL